MLKQSWLESRSSSPRSKATKQPSISTRESPYNRNARSITQLENKSLHMHVDQQSLNAMLSSSSINFSPKERIKKTASVALPTSPVKVTLKVRHSTPSRDQKLAPYRLKKKDSIGPIHVHLEEKRMDKNCDETTTKEMKTNASANKPDNAVNPTQFQIGKTGIYKTLWQHANTTTTFKYAQLWEQNSPRHKYI